MKNREVITEWSAKQIRVYDIMAARRPVLDVEVGKTPIKRISVGSNDEQIIYADTTNNLGAVEVKNGKVVAQYKGICVAKMNYACRFLSNLWHLTGLTGAATAVCTTTIKEQGNEKVVVSVSLDRFLRVHETSTIHRKLINKAYLKQRLTAVLVDEDYEIEKPPTEEQEDDELWNNMSVASNKRKNRSWIKHNFSDKVV